MLSVATTQFHDHASRPLERERADQPRQLGGHLNIVPVSAHEYPGPARAVPAVGAVGPLWGDLSIRASRVTVRVIRRQAVRTVCTRRRNPESKAVSA
jgi:hypothetical protein